MDSTFEYLHTDKLDLVRHILSKERQKIQD